MASPRPSGFLARPGTLAWALPLLASLAVIQDAGAEPYYARKDVTWTFKGIPAADTLVTLECTASTFAKDQHLVPPNVSNTSKCITDGTVSDPIQFEIAGGGDNIISSSGEDPHPYSEAFAGGSIGNTTFIADPDTNTAKVTVEMEVRGRTDLPTDTDTHKHPQATAFSEVNMRVPSGVAGKATITENKQKVEVKNNFVGGRSTFHRRTSEAKARDPISIELLDLDTGDLFTEELFSIDWSVTGDALLEFDTDLGIVLDVPADGFSNASFAGGFHSDWIVVPMEPFAVSLADGVFSATGAFAGLGWMLTLDGSDVVRATLAADQMPNFATEYLVPDALLTDGHTYRQTLVLGLSGDAAEAAPAPGTVLLLVAGLVPLLRRRRTRPSQ